MYYIEHHNDLHRHQHTPPMHGVRPQLVFNHYNPHEKKVHPVLKFIYKYDDIYEEVYKRTSFLSKHRPTEQLSHQLNTMSFTRDEDFMFKPFIQQAAANIYEKLYPFSKKVKDGYVYKEHVETVELEEHPNIKDYFLVKDADSDTFRDDVVETIAGVGERIKLSAQSEVVKHKPLDYTKYGVRVTAAMRYSIKDSDDVSAEPTLTYVDEMMSQDVSARRNKNITWKTEVFVPNNTEAPQGFVFNAIESVEIVSIALLSKTPPMPIARGKYVVYGGELFRVVGDATTDSDINNQELFERVVVDDRDAVVFSINALEWMDENVFGITDNAIFEAIVNYVMCQWFMSVAPAEAEICSTKYTNALLDIVHRLNAQKKSLRRRYNLF